MSVKIVRYNISARIQRSFLLPMAIRYESPLLVLDKCSIAILLEGDLQFLLRVHDDRPVPCDWFTDVFSRDEEKPNR
jgi:hypothetical protein